MSELQTQAFYVALLTVILYKLKRLSRHEFWFLGWGVRVGVCSGALMGPGLCRIKRRQQDNQDASSGREGAYPGGNACLRKERIGLVMHSG